MSPHRSPQTYPSADQRRRWIEEIVRKHPASASVNSTTIFEEIRKRIERTDVGDFEELTPITAKNLRRYLQRDLAALSVAEGEAPGPRQHKPLLRIPGRPFRYQWRDIRHDRSNPGDYPFPGSIDHALIITLLGNCLEPSTIRVVTAAGAPFGKLYNQSVELLKRNRHRLVTDPSPYIFTVPADFVFNIDAFQSRLLGLAILDPPYAAPLAQASFREHLAEFARDSDAAGRSHTLPLMPLDSALTSTAARPLLDVMLLALHKKRFRAKFEQEFRNTATFFQDSLHGRRFPLSTGEFLINPLGIICHRGNFYLAFTLPEHEDSKKDKSSKRLYVSRMDNFRDPRDTGQEAKHGKAVSARLIRCVLDSKGPCFPGELTKPWRHILQIEIRLYTDVLATGFSLPALLSVHRFGNNQEAYFDDDSGEMVLKFQSEASRRLIMWLAWMRTLQDGTKISVSVKPTKEVPAQETEETQKWIECCIDEACRLDELITHGMP